MSCVLAAQAKRPISCEAEVNRIGTKARFGTVPTAERQAAIAASGETPLDYMIRVMRDQSASVERRDEMAKAAAPYVHPRLAAIEYAGIISGKPPDQMTDEQLMAIIREGQAKEAEERKLRN
jgi:hypothetical protein